MKAFLFVALTLGISTNASARIGETPDQCTARYGKPAQIGKSYTTGNGWLTYRKDGVIIEICFFNKVAQWVNYTREDGTEFTQKQCEVLRIANCQQPWKSDTSEPEFGFRKWVSKSGVSGQQEIGKPTLEFQTAYVKAGRLRAKLAKEAAAVSGL